MLTPAGLAPASVVVRDGFIVRVITDPESPPADCALVDLGEQVLMPGLVDSHVHVNEPGRTEWEGFASATDAAALGGVIAIADMPLNSSPTTTTLSALETKIAAMRGKLRVDCALWGGVVPGNTDELASMVERGVRGFKCFMCPSGIDEFEHVQAHDLEQAMPVLRRLGVPLLAHAEIELPVTPLAPGAAREYSTYLHSRPPAWEDAAIALLIELCRRTGCAVHVVHLSSASALPLIARAKREGLPVTVETCPHYLCLRAEDIADGATEFKCAPPIRDGANREALWDGLARGVIDFVVTDHSPCIPGLKLQEEGDFLRAWGGIASLQLGLASVATAARQRGFDLATLSRWMTQGPLTLLGERAGGAIGAGMRADLVAWDLDAEFEVQGARLAHRHPITPYAGRRLQGRVSNVWLRGQRIVQDSALCGARTGQLWQPTGMRS